MTDRPRPMSCSPSADRDLLERGFRRLPPEQRAILVLHHYLGLRPVRDRRDPRHPGRDGPLTTPPRPSRHAGRPRGGRSGRGQGRPTGMTQQRDIERLLDLWFADGPTEAPRPGHRRRRRSHRASTPATRVALLIWRDIHVNTMLRAGIAIAAVVVVAVVGFNLLPGQSNGIGGPAPAPTPVAERLAAVAAPSPQRIRPRRLRARRRAVPVAVPGRAGHVHGLHAEACRFTAPAGYIVLGGHGAGVRRPTAAGSPPGGFFIVPRPGSVDPGQRVRG